MGRYSPQGIKASRAEGIKELKVLKPHTLPLSRIFIRIAGMNAEVAWQQALGGMTGGREVAGPPGWPRETDVR